jgi:esterase/lipase superfamily enzyme
MLNSKQGAEQKEVIVVLFSWPSNGSMMPWAAYKSDRVDARNSGASIGRGLLKLRDFLGMLKRESSSIENAMCGSNVHLLCHSMGNYVLRNAIQKKLIGYCRGRMPRIFKHVFLCAADEDDDTLEGENGLSRLHELASFVTVYYNREDLALYISDTTKGHPDRLGQSGSARPALVHNKVHQVDCTPLIRGLTEHSYYLWATVNQDIRQSINAIEFTDSQRNRKLNGQNREWTLT